MEFQIKVSNGLECWSLDDLDNLIRMRVRDESHVLVNNLATISVSMKKWEFVVFKAQHAFWSKDSKS